MLLGQQQRALARQHHAARAQFLDVGCPQLQRGADGDVGLFGLLLSLQRRHPQQIAQRAVGQLGGTQRPQQPCLLKAQAEQASHALVVANRMLDILIRQNEKRNLALLRTQDVLVKPSLQDIGFADFSRAPEIVARGEQALIPVQAQLSALRTVFAAQPPVQTATRLAFDQREKRIVAIEAQGHKDVSERYIQTMLSPMTFTPKS